MADQCRNCSARGDIKKCRQEKDCSIKESWYAIEANEVIQELWKQLKDYGCNPEDALLDRLEVIATAHDSAIRREFAEKVCELLKNELRIISPTTEEKLYTHIRAMAEKEG